MDCILTGKKVQYENNGNYISYDLKIVDNEIQVFLCSGCKYTINMPVHIVMGLIANKK